MTGLTIWHNPRCSKSRQTLALLQQNGHSPDVRLYLKDPPGTDEIASVLALLGLPARAMLRRGEAVLRTLDIDLGGPQDALIAAMAAHPVLIERPIVISGKKAAIGRPPEAVLDIL